MCVRQIRNQAYQKLTNEFKMAEDEKSKVYKQYISFFKKVVLALRSIYIYICTLFF